MSDAELSALRTAGKAGGDTEPARMKYAKVCANRFGLIKPAMLAKLAIAPCNCPCSDMLTRRVIRPCAAGPANPQNAITEIPRQ